MRTATDKTRLYHRCRQLSHTFQTFHLLHCRLRYFSVSTTAWKKKGINRYAQRLKEKQLEDAKREAQLTDESITPPNSEPESKVPDHRDIGTAYNLFTSSSYSPGSPLFHPNGAHIFNKLIAFLRAQYPQFGIEEVITPTIYKQSLWKKSGHWDTYADAMYQVEGRSAGTNKTSAEPDARTINAEFEGEKAGDDGDNVRKREHDDGGAGAGDNDESIYGLKPMNCPGHCLLYSSIRRSYRDLPIRYADFSTLHRNEVSGSLTGLTRLRRFHQDDGHIFCRPSQVQTEIARTLAFVQLVYDKLGMGKYKLILSTRPETKIGEALGNGFIGSIEAWDQAEAQLRQVLRASGQKWDIARGEAAFYGPKIDVLLQDALGRWHQTATIQLDFQTPRRFGLTYATTPKVQLRDRMLNFDLDDSVKTNKGEINSSEDNTATVSDDNNNNSLTASNQATPVLIHRAILGSIERFLALLLEHYNGTFPFWLSPRPVILLSVSQGSATIAYIRKLAVQLSGYSLVSPHSTSSLSLKPPLLSASSRNKLKSKSKSKLSNPNPSLDPATIAVGGSDALEPDSDPDNPEDILLFSNPTAQSLLHARVPIRVDVDISAVTLGRKIKAAKKQGYNHILVVGPKDAEEGTVQVEIWNQCVKRDMHGKLMTQVEAQAGTQRRTGPVNNHHGLKDLEKVQGWLAEAAATATMSADNSNDDDDDGKDLVSKGEKLREIRRDGHVRVHGTALRSYFERLIDEYM